MRRPAGEGQRRAAAPAAQLARHLVPGRFRRRGPKSRRVTSRCARSVRGPGWPDGARADPCSPRRLTPAEPAGSAVRRTARAQPHPPSVADAPGACRSGRRPRRPRRGPRRRPAPTPAHPSRFGRPTPGRRTRRATATAQSGRLAREGSAQPMAVTSGWLAQPSSPVNHSCVADNKSACAGETSRSFSRTSVIARRCDAVLAASTKRLLLRVSICSNRAAASSGGFSNR